MDNSNNNHDNIMSEQDIDRLKSLVMKTLESKGVLSRLRAEVRANVFMAIDDESSLASQPSLYLEDAPDRQLALSLVRDLLETYQLNLSLNVFVPEAGLPASGMNRTEMAEKLQMQMPPSASTQGEPLLVILARQLALSGGGLADSAEVFPTQTVNRSEVSSGDQSLSKLALGRPGETRAHQSNPASQSQSSVDFRDSGENPLNSVNFSTDSEGPISSWRPSSVPKGGEDTDNADQAAAVEKWGVSESTTKAEQEEKVVSEIEEEDDEEEEEEDEEDEEEDADQESPSKGSDAAGQIRESTEAESLYEDGSFEEESVDEVEDSTQVDGGNSQDDASRAALSAPIPSGPARGLPPVGKAGGSLLGNLPPLKAPGAALSTNPPQKITASPPSPVDSLEEDSDLEVSEGEEVTYAQVVEGRHKSPVSEKEDLLQEGASITVAPSSADNEALEAAPSPTRAALPSRGRNASVGVTLQSKEGLPAVSRLAQDSPHKGDAGGDVSASQSESESDVGDTQGGPSDNGRAARISAFLTAVQSEDSPSSQEGRKPSPGSKVVQVESEEEGSDMYSEDGFDHTMEESGVSFQASSSSPVASPPSVERKTDAKLAPLSSTSTSGPLGKLPPLTGPPSRASNLLANKNLFALGGRPANEASDEESSEADSPPPAATRPSGNRFSFGEEEKGAEIQADSPEPSRKPTTTQRPTNSAVSLTASTSSGGRVPTASSVASSRSTLVSSTDGEFVDLEADSVDEDSDLEMSEDDAF